MSVQPEVSTPSLSSSLLGGAGSAALAVVRHVPVRALLWAVLGMLGGALAVAASLLLGVLTLDGGAASMLRGARFLVPLLLPVIGFIAFGLHGANRGVAHAALALEAQWGLVAQLVGRAIALIDQHLGTRLANLPLAQAESALKGVIRTSLGSEETAQRRGGLTGWVLRQARALLTAKVEACLLSAYRAEYKTDAAGGGGIDLAKVRDRAVEQLTGHLREFLLGPLNGQLMLLLVLFFGLGIGWYHLGLGLVALVG